MAAKSAAAGEEEEEEDEDLLSTVAKKHSGEGSIAGQMTRRVTREILPRMMARMTERSRVVEGISGADVVVGRRYRKTAGWHSFRSLPSRSVQHPSRLPRSEMQRNPRCRTPSTPIDLLDWRSSSSAANTKVKGIDG